MKAVYDSLRIETSVTASYCNEFKLETNKQENEMAKFVKEVSVSSLKFLLFFIQIAS